jgi:hypothetical protein
MKSMVKKNNSAAINPERLTLNLILRTSALKGLQANISTDFDRSEINLNMEIRL